MPAAHHAARHAVGRGEGVHAGVAGAWPRARPASSQGLAVKGTVSTQAGQVVLIYRRWGICVGGAGRRVQSYTGAGRARVGGLLRRYVRGAGGLQ